MASAWIGPAGRRQSYHCHDSRMDMTVVWRWLEWQDALLQTIRLTRQNMLLLTWMLSAFEYRTRSWKRGLPPTKRKADHLTASPTDGEDNGSAVERCAVCMEHLKAHGDSSGDDAWDVTPCCRARMHYICLQQWLQRGSGSHTVVQSFHKLGVEC